MLRTTTPQPPIEVMLGESAWTNTATFGATLVLLAITVYYAWQTRNTVQEMRRAKRPVVFLDIIALSRTEIALDVGNCGDVAAKDVRFTVRETIQSAVDIHGSPISEAQPLATGLRYIAPGRTLRFRFKVDPQIVGSHEPTGTLILAADLAYTGLDDLAHSESITIDFSQLTHLDFPQAAPGPEYLAESIASLTREVSSLSSNIASGPKTGP